MPGNKISGEEGVTELVGAMLLVSLAIAGVAIISVIIFSGTPSQPVPQIDILTGINSDQNRFYLYNDGGDSLSEGDYRILVDLGSGYTDLTGSFSISGGGSTWAPGDYLVYTYPAGTPPESVNIIYTGYGGETLLSSTPLLYSGDDGASQGTGDSGVVLIPPDTYSEVVIKDKAQLKSSLESSLDSTLEVHINDTVMPVLNVDALIYNYDNVEINPANPSKNAFAIRMESLNPADPNTYTATVHVNALEKLLDGATPANISIVAVAYDQNIILHTDSVMVNMTRS